MQVLGFLYKGNTPLLMNNPAAMRQEKPTAKVKQKEYSAEDGAANSRYLLPSGDFYVPAIAVRSSLLNGAKFLKKGKMSMPAILSGALELNDEFFPLLDEAGNAISGDRYTIDTRRAVIQKAGILRSRAKIELPWYVQCYFMYDPALFSREDLITVANRAGTMAGLLDYRPEKKGWFGKYEIVEDSIEM